MNYYALAQTSLLAVVVIILGTISDSLRHIADKHETRNERASEAVNLLSGMSDSLRRIANKLSGANRL